MASTLCLNPHKDATLQDPTAAGPKRVSRHPRNVSNWKTRHAESEESEEDYESESDPEDIHEVDVDPRGTNTTLSVPKQPKRWRDWPANEQFKNYGHQGCKHIHTEDIECVCR